MVTAPLSQAPPPYSGPYAIRRDLVCGVFRHLGTTVTAVTSIDTPTVPILTPYGILFPGPVAVVNA
jgi:hypothetical protein